MKKNDVKKIFFAGNWNGVLPILMIESRYNVFIVTGMAGACSRVAMTR